VDKHDLGATMAEMDPSKVVKVFEDLFGRRFGRLVATLLLAAVTLFLLFWCFDGIWKHGGNAVFEAFGGLSFPRPEGFFTADNAPALASAFILILVLYGSIVVAILYFLGRALFKKHVPQAVADTLAELRNEGIDTVYAVPINDDAHFLRWKQTKDKWMKKLRDHIEKTFPRADYLFASHLGVVPLQNNLAAYNGEHLRELCFVVRQMDIVEQILNSYRR
jgi:hypothetical protein